jgi:hypothetical protein
MKSQRRENLSSTGRTNERRLKYDSPIPRAPVKFTAVRNMELQKWNMAHF